jgi:hypothetical protein
MKPVIVLALVASIVAALVLRSRTGGSASTSTGL